MFETWKLVTSVRKYRGAVYIELHTKICVRSIHLFLKVFSVSTVAVNFATDVSNCSCFRTMERCCHQLQAVI